MSVIRTDGIQRWSGTYLEVVEIRDVEVPHFAPVNEIASVLGMAAHGSGARAAIEATGDLFGGEPDPMAQRR